MKILLTLGAAVIGLMLIATIATQLDGDRYDPARSARLQAEAAWIAREAEAEAFWQPVRAAAVNLAGITALFLSLAGAAAWGSVALARFRRERQPDSRGLLPVPVALLAAEAPVALGAYHGARQLEAGRQLVPHTLTYHAPHYRADAGRAALLPADVAPAAPALPGLTDLVSLAHRPTVDNILLGLGAGGDRITVPMRSLWHIGTAGPTGAGKSNIARLILPQLQAIGAKVAIIDPKWTPYDHESGEDWRPIGDRLFLPPARKAAEIADTIGYFADELERRLELRNAGQRVGSPLFLYADEFTTITADVKDANERIARLARLGRGVGVFLLIAAHDLLVRSGAGDTRDQLRTGFYLGGDAKTGAVLLDMPQKDVTVAESQLTTGVALLRCAAGPARPVRVPYASNAGIVGLLGADAPAAATASCGASADRPLGFRPARPGSTREAVAEGSASTASERDKLTAEEARIVALFKSGKTPHQIAVELSGATGGRAYQEAQARIAEALRKAMRGDS